MRPLWSTLRDRVVKDGRVALVTVIGAEGSTPRESGARMIVTVEGAILGTIGGGTLEYRLINEARAALHQEAWQTSTKDVPLGPDLGQCCGGRISYLIEIFSPADAPHLDALASYEEQGDFACEGQLGAGSHLHRRVIENEPHLEMISMSGDVILESFADDRTPILLFGAGHVGRALTMALAPLPFRVRWIDSRDDAFPALVPHNVTPVYAADMEAEIQAAPANSIIVVMTHSHPLDLAIVSASLRRDELRFIGLIGSDTKRARFLKRLREIGLGDAAEARLVCPIGLQEISGKEPAVIAASIVADLLIRREALIQHRDDEQFSTHSFNLDIGDHPHER